MTSKQLYGWSAVPHNETLGNIPNLFRAVINMCINRAVTIMSFFRGYIKSKIGGYK
jgi:hypothetical protein